MVTVPFINSVVFTNYEFCKRMLGVTDQATSLQSVFCGMYAGFVNSFFLSPIELVKCRLQVQSESMTNSYYKGSMDCVKKVVLDEGIRQGLFKGTVATISREVPCYAA